LGGEGKVHLQSSPELVTEEGKNMGGGPWETASNKCEGLQKKGNEYWGRREGVMEGKEKRSASPHFSKG